MTQCTTKKELFQPVKSRKIDVAFDGGCVTSDAGILLLRQVDKLLDLTRRIRFHLSSHYPWKHLFLLVADRLNTS